MKIICDSCGTKYSISDDKVRGKVFKIRCKKCSHIIVVRGGEAPAEEAAPTVEGGWHIVIDGEQVGPISEADVRARIERGEIRGDTYTWKEGFADWVKLASIPEFAGMAGDSGASGGNDLFPSEPAANGTERSRRPSGVRSPLFSSGGEDVFANPAASPRAGADLFASSPAAHAAPAEEPHWPTSGAAMAGHDGGRVENLTAQRHENSVLFSLANLQSLAMPSAAPKASAPTTTAPTPDGSGLIDIRAMAASTLPTTSSSSSSSYAADDLPAFGAFAPTAPVLLPLPSASGPPKWIYLVIVLMVAGAGGVGFLAWKVMTARSPLEPERVVVQVPVPVPAQPAPAKPGDQAAAPSTIPEDKLPPREGDAKPEGKSETKSSKKSSRSSKDSKKASADDKKGAAVAAAAPPVVDTGPKPAKGSLEDLLAGATNSRAGARSGGDDKRGAAQEAPSAGPLAKNAVVAGMNSVKPKIAECYNQFKVPGMAMVNVVIGKNGKVSSATVTGKFAGTPTGACVEKAVKTATFPPSDGLSTPYPFQLK